MAESTCQVIFTGQFAPGYSRPQILASLSQLLHRDTGAIRALFHGTDAVIIRSTSYDQAQKYVTSLNQTGAICTIRVVPLDEPKKPTVIPTPMPEPEPVPAVAVVEPVPETTPPSPVAPPPAEIAPAVPSEPPPQAEKSPEIAPPPVGEAERPHPAEQQQPKRRAPVILDPLPGPADITLSAHGCANAGAIPEGICTNRKDWAALPFTDIRMLACFKATENLDEIKLLLFPRSSRRPLLIEGNTISFAQFPGVADGKLFATFRRFLKLIFFANPRIAVDRATARFMQGEPPPQFLKDPVVLISDLSRAYDAAKGR